MAPKKAAKKSAKKALLDGEHEHGREHGEKKHTGKKHKGEKRGDEKRGEERRGEERRGEEKRGKELRRAYEHLGRLSVLEKNVAGRSAVQIKRLTELAQRSLLAQDAKSAADLLRAGEHLAFGSLAATTRATRLSEALEQALRTEYEHLVEKAAEHWKRHEQERPVEIAEVYEAMLAAAEVAQVKGAYRRALEFARGAEALAHVRGIEAERGKALERERRDELEG
jgi:ATP-dependent protease HslVU (ClpYQ) peptidase subunit